MTTSPRKNRIERPGANERPANENDEEEERGIGERTRSTHATREDFSSCSLAASCYPMPPMSDNSAAV